MKLIGAAVNCVAVFLGSLLGLLFKKGIPERVQKSLNYALSLCVLYIGIKGSFKGENTLIAALSLAIGTIIGELIDIDRHLNKFGDFLQKKLSRNTENSSFGEGFVNATLFTCVGSVLIIAIALNTMKVTKIKVANLLPSAFMPLLLCLFIH